MKLRSAHMTTPHLWFAWRPVECDSGQIKWMVLVWRWFEPDDDYLGGPGKWHYTEAVTR